MPDVHQIGEKWELDHAAGKQPISGRLTSVQPLCQRANRSRDHERRQATPAPRVARLV